MIEENSRDVTEEENDTMTEIVVFLRQHDKEICKRGTEGCEISSRIMRYYTMLYACHDAMTKVLLEKEIENYKEKYFNKTPNIT